MTLRLKVLLSVLLVLGLGLLLARCKHDRHVDQQISSPVLASTDTQKIIVNPSKHTIQVITHHSDETLSLPGDRSISITEDNHGKLSIENRTWGTEHTPYVGLGYSNNPTVFAGLSLFYWHGFDLNVGVGPVLNTTGRALLIRGLAGMSWNFYNNTSLLIGIDTAKYPVVGVMVRL